MLVSFCGWIGMKWPILNLGEYTPWHRLLGQLPVFCVRLHRDASVCTPRASEMQEGSCSWSHDRLTCGFLEQNARDSPCSIALAA